MPDTAAYLYLGLAVTFGIIGFYGISLLLRFRNAVQDITMIEQFSDDE
ncbi:MAG: hypothetical protein ACPG7F_03835 [Aggregatilineales bacterium]